MTNTERSKDKPIPSATILLLRDGDQGLEVFMVVRHRQVDFASGAMVFPGGKLAPGDWNVRQHCRGADAQDDRQLALRVGAIREAFEESGVLLASRVGQDALLSAEEVEALGDRYRRGLDKGQIGIGEMLEKEGLELVCDGLTAFAHWITPAFMPKRFDTMFFLAEAPAGQLAGHDDHEVVDSEWVRPAEVLRRVEAGEVTMVPATSINVDKLGQSRTVADALGAARQSRIVAVEPQLVSKDKDSVTLSIPSDAGYAQTQFSFSVG